MNVYIAVVFVKNKYNIAYKSANTTTLYNYHNSGITPCSGHHPFTCFTIPHVFSFRMDVDL